MPAMFFDRIAQSIAGMARSPPVDGRQSPLRQVLVGGAEVPASQETTVGRQRRGMRRAQDAVAAACR